GVSAGGVFVGRLVLVGDGVSVSGRTAAVNVSAWAVKTSGEGVSDEWVPSAELVSEGLFNAASVMAAMVAFTARSNSSGLRIDTLVPPPAY
ncbi:MAG: hypothetical protein OEY93_11025, partial [Anaerolineae bacterium]|nr:hypothetical protein [Anaerolineae bacterium]